MNTEKIIYNRFIKPFVGKTSRNIGCELEFPLINSAGGNIDVPFVSSISEHFEKIGFVCVLRGIGGEKLFMENKSGDCVSFDNSYNNFEFSMHFGSNLTEQYKRFKEYFNYASEYLKSGGHELCGRGTNPNYGKIKVNHAPFATYNMVQDFLHRFPGEHSYSDFPAFLSSVQTHLDVEADMLPFAYTTFAKLDFVRAILFANSPDFEGKGYRIFRDYLWEKSGFGNCPGITGKIDDEFSSIDDIVHFFMKKGMFNRIRNGKYEIFQPVPICDYFENPIYGAEENDIECYLSFRSVEITSRGTLEIRGDCTQPLDRSFAPPAFNTGIRDDIKRARMTLDSFLRKNCITLSNTELRNIVAEGKNLEEIAPLSEIKSLTDDLLDISYTALKKRGFGEEKLLIKNQF